MSSINPALATLLTILCKRNSGDVYLQINILAHFTAYSSTVNQARLCCILDDMINKFQLHRK